MFFKKAFSIITNPRNVGYMDDNYPNVGIVSQCDDQEGVNRDFLRKSV